MRNVAVVLCLIIMVVSSTAQASAAPARPDLSGYTEVSAAPYTIDGDVYFQAPNGLCAFFLTRGSGGCDGGQFPGTLPGVNEITLAGDADSLGLHATSNNKKYVRPGPAVPVLRDGQKIVFGDYACAAGPGSRTTCTKGSPANQWMVISTKGTGIGPATSGLPAGFPTAYDFVLGDESYIGYDPANYSPMFTVDGGLTCSIHSIPANSSDRDFGCDGTLPGVAGGENEVFASAAGAAGTRRTDHPQFSIPTSKKPVSHLPVGYRVQQVGATCMAITGGVACYSGQPGAIRGFMVSAGHVVTI